MKYLILGIFLIIPFISTATGGGNEHGVGVGPAVSLDPETRDIIDGLFNPDVVIQWVVLNQLKLSQAKNPMVQQQLTKMQSNANSIIKWKAGKILRDSKSVISKLANKLTNLKVKIQQAKMKVWAYGQLINTQERLNEALYINYPGVRQQIVKNVGDRKIDDPLIQLTLVNFLKDSDPIVRLETVMALGKSTLTDSAIQQRINDIFYVSSSNDLYTKKLADRFESSQVTIRKELVEALSDSNPIVRWEIVRALEPRLPGGTITNLTMQQKAVEAIFSEKHHLLLLRIADIIDLNFLNSDTVNRIMQLMTESLAEISAIKMIGNTMLNDSDFQQKLNMVLNGH